MKKVTIGLFGFGVVGEGIYQVLSEKQALNASIKKVVIKHPEKSRNAPAELFTTDADEVLHDDAIDLIVELIDDAEAAYTIVTNAMRNGKSVISANKKMIAEHHLELIQISRDHQVSFLYEAAVCGSVPIIRNLEEYFDNDLLISVEGIVNGSTNFILCKMLQEGEDYANALHHAQVSGFAESNPHLDVEGIDAAYKLSIIGLHAFGKQIDVGEILRKGITSLHPFDFQYAKEKDYVIKLIAKATVNEHGELDTLSVLPTFVSRSGIFGQTNNEYNGVVVGSVLADEQFFYGKGAGRFPTSSAVLSDISAYTYQYKYGYKKGLTPFRPNYDRTGRYYIACDKALAVDRALFDEIDEEFINHDRSYIIGKIRQKNLLLNGILNNPQISIISLN